MTHKEMQALIMESDGPSVEGLVTEVATLASRHCTWLGGEKGQCWGLGSRIWLFRVALLSDS